ncbi:serine protease [uncultured Roseobacter sp.]|uniref:S1 family peptidase n=1 Tax=uncultured Roseobacter sp. TaxID=114847 RepID=UPI002615B33E|nr:serine protease [uncultured Roseobacter sp.]
MAATFLSMPGLALAQFNPGQVESSVVRVVVGAGTENARAASGFVWNDDGFVVTTLHAVPGGLDILVKCRGESFPATVAGVLKEADLIALQTGPMPNCAPLSEQIKSTTPPSPGDRLHTLGHHESSQSKTSRSMEKGYADPEILRYLTSGPTRDMLAQFNIPSLDLEIFYVQGGLLPGYSGAPVFDSANRLIGIVDGGLNKGTSNYNWVIPASNIEKLMQKVAASETTIPPEVAQIQGILFSSPSADESAGTVVEFTEHNRDFRFVLSKTASLADLLVTADDPEGVEIFLEDYRLAAGVEDDVYEEMIQQLQFDIYEDEYQQLIIAVPAGQPLTYEELDPEGNPGISALLSSSQGLTASLLTFEVLPEGDIPSGILSLSGYEWYGVDDPAFFDKVVDGLIEDCKAMEDTCDEHMAVEIPFDDPGVKVVKAGLRRVTGGPDVYDAYDYFSFAVDGEFIFKSTVTIFPFFDDPDRCEGAITCPSDPDLALEQYTQLLAVHLTTFR